MRYAIISDIHGNLEAFREVKKDIRKEKVDKCLFLGDVVGYGANPSECLRELRKMGCICVAGNHDWGAIGLTSLKNFNPYAREAIQWTKEQLSEEDKEFIQSIPLVKEIEDITLVHATLYKPEEWNYIFSTFQAHVNIELQKTSIVFVGHSHVPIVFFESPHSQESIQFTREEEIEIKKGFKYIINVGSVGQPRDGDPRASYGIYDDEKGIVRIKRITYDISKAQQKIRDAHLPEILAERLEYGE